MITPPIRGGRIERARINRPPASRWGTARPMMTSAGKAPKFRSSSAAGSSRLRRKIWFGWRRNILARRAKIGPSGRARRRPHDNSVEADVEAVAADFLSRDTGNAINERRSSSQASSSGGQTTIGSSDRPHGTESDRRAGPGVPDEDRRSFAAQAHEAGNGARREAENAAAIDSLVADWRSEENSTLDLALHEMELDLGQSAS